jgi:hypothetical protein
MPRKAAIRPPGLNIRITSWTVVSCLGFFAVLPTVPFEWFVGGVGGTEVVDMMLSFEAMRNVRFRIVDFQSRLIT